MGASAEVVATVLALVVVSAGLGYRIAKDQGRSPVMGLLVGAGLSIFGLGILLMVGKKIQHRNNHHSH
ncbi:MAG: hypothetical protein KBC81_03105 [Candidatus Pacebacteria bacterium]|nr:hypothetical protein [Candidatus Paceibacterota bacterium]